MLCVSWESGSFWVCVTGGTHRPYFLRADSGFVGWAAGAGEGPRPVQLSQTSWRVMAHRPHSAPSPYATEVGVHCPFHKGQT